MRIDVGEPLGFPLIRLACNSHRDLDVRSPERESLLADAARRQDEKWSSRLAARHAHRRDNFFIEAIRFTKCARLVAEAHSAMRCIKRHTRDNFSRCGSHCGGSGISVRVALKCLCDSGIDEGLINGHMTDDLETMKGLAYKAFERQAIGLGCMQLTNQTAWISSPSAKNTYLPNHPGA